MIETFKRVFSPPHFEDDEDNFRARFINGTTWILIIALSLSLIPQLINPTADYTLIVLIGLVSVMSLSQYLMRKGHLTLSGLIVVIPTWLGITFQALTSEGVKDVIVVGYITVGLLASLIISWRTGGLIIFLSTATLWGFAYLQVLGQINPLTQPPMGYARDFTVILVVTAALIYFSTTSLSEAVHRANVSEESLRASNQELQELNERLEDRVSKRTAELEVANQRNERRARQFAAVAQVAHATASSLELQELLPKLVDVISQQFGFYHVGIFLLDENREYAVLRAANSEGGKRMLQNGHRLAFGQKGIVGFVAATGAPRIALDVGADAVFFDNPDLPATRSEMGLPLRSGNDVIGVLDVQSKEPNAFQPEDVEVLSTLADLVTIAIQNARSFEVTQDLLKEAQRTSSDYLQQSWKVLQSQETYTGYQTMGNVLKRLNEPISSPEIQKAVANRQTVTESGDRATVAVPIRLREDVIGVMNIRLSEGQNLDQDDVDIAEAVAERLSLAIETALLLKTTQKRAEIERITSEISTRISSSTQFEAILRTAAEELSRVLGGSEVIVQLQSSNLPEQANEPSMA